MEETKSMEFRKGFEIIFKGEITFYQSRRMGLNLAREHNAPIDLIVYNDALGKWQRMYLTFYPDGFAYDNKGVKYDLDDDGRNFWRVK